MNIAPLQDAWVYLAASPLLWLTLTLLAYLLAFEIHRRSGFKAVANPVLIAIVLLVAVLSATATPYAQYFDGAQFVHFLLGPATVALAVPLYRQLQRLKRLALPILAALVAGSLTAALSAYLIAGALGASLPTMHSLAPKSVTTPIAMAIAERLGGLSSLAAVLVILTGIVGAVCGSALIKLLRIEDDAATGFALGLASHGIGTARAFQLGETAGAFAALAMGVNGLFTAMTLPWLLPLLEGWIAR